MIPDGDETMDSKQQRHLAKQARRNMRNKLRRNGDKARLLGESEIRVNGNVVKCDRIRAQYHYAQRRASYIERFGVHHEFSRKMDQSHLWQRRDDRSLGDLWEPGNKPANGKQTKRR